MKLLSALPHILHSSFLTSQDNRTMRTHLLAILSANSVSAAVTGAYVQWSGGGDVRFLSPWLDGFGALSAGTAVGL